MKKPNFFIIGAPKCGTTSMAYWLGEHPQAFLSPRKEPHFFSEISPDLKRIEDYERLFEPASEAHHIVVDASTSYMEHAGALEKLRAYAPEARYMVMLRNPVEMAHSLHGQQLWGGVETEPDFERAWRLQDQRRNKASLLFPEIGPTLLYYQRCRVGQQLNRALDLLPRERLLILFLEDVAADPRSQYRKVLDFAGLTDDGRTSFPRENSAKIHRFPRTSRLLGRLGRLRLRLGLRRGFGIHRRFSEISRQKISRPPLDPVFEAELYEVFRPEVELLEELTGRDLAHWKQRPERRAAAE